MKSKSDDKSSSSDSFSGWKLTWKRIAISTLVCAISYILYDRILYEKPSPVIRTIYGKVQGTEGQSRRGRAYFQYLGIPFAAPPLGELRFEPPQPPTPWEGIRSANRFSSECAQMEIMATGRIMGKEDCLYLNVFTPKLKTKKLLPVMVFLYGGLFMAGSADLYNGGYFMDEDVLLVTVNYRVGALGFLNTGLDGVVRGNMGLKDQNMALKWVQSNIYNFGGDPNRVTLFGESAGGASVHYHIISKQSSGLFHKAISQSGTAAFKWVLNPAAERQARNFGNHFGCPTNNSRDMVSCLKTVPAHDLVRSHRPIMYPIHKAEDAFLPTVETVLTDDTFLSAHPVTLIKKGNFSKIPWMAGVTSDEGLYLIARMLLNETVTSSIGPKWNETLPPLLNYQSTGSEEAAMKIRERYFGGVDEIKPRKNFRNFAKLFTDYWFHADFSWAVQQHAKRAPMYLYYFSYRSRKSLFPLFLLASQDDYIACELKVAVVVIRDLFNKFVLGRSTPTEGACHADDLPMLFNFHPLVYIKENAEDYDLSMEMVKTWASFAQDKTPLTFNGLTWPLMQPGSQDLKFLNLSIPGSIIDDPVKEAPKFWKSLKLKSELTVE